MKRVVVEIGMGTDIRGADYTQAAVRALRDALWLPHGTGTVTVVEGGLEIFNDAGTSSTVIANAAAIVRLDIA